MQAKSALLLAVCGCSSTAPTADLKSIDANTSVSAPSQSSSAGPMMTSVAKTATRAPAAMSGPAGSPAVATTPVVASQTSAGAGGVSAAPTDAGAAAGSTAKAPDTPAVACNPADMLPEAQNVPLDSIRGSSNPAAIVPAKGPLPPVVEQDPGIDTQTVYRPMTLEGKLPIIVWANCGCAKNGTMFARFLLEIATITSSTPRRSQRWDSRALV